MSKKTKTAKRSKSRTKRKSAAKGKKAISRKSRKIKKKKKKQSGKLARKALRKTTAKRKATKKRAGARKKKSIYVVDEVGYQVSAGPESYRIARKSFISPWRPHRVKKSSRRTIQQALDISPQRSKRVATIVRNMEEAGSIRGIE